MGERDYDCCIAGVEYDSKWAMIVEQTLKMHLMNMAEIVMDDADHETPSGFPFCGCEECEVREILALLVPIIVQATNDGYVRMEQETAS